MSQYTGIKVIFSNNMWNKLDEKYNKACISYVKQKGPMCQLKSHYIISDRDRGIKRQKQCT